MAISTIFYAKLNASKCGVDDNALMKLPNEVIITILQHLSIPDLLTITILLNYRIHTLAKKVLVDKLSVSNNCHLRLCFDQEHHWRFTVDFKLTKAINTRLAFTPVKQVSVRMYTSKLLRRPNLYKASLVGPDFAIESDHLLNNLIKSPISLDIKETGLHQKRFQQQNISLAYQITKTPEHMVKERPGERWVEPLGFECSFDFLCQTKKMIQRVFDTLHNRPTRRQIDNRSFTTSSRLPTSSRNHAVAEIGGLWQQKYHYLSPSEKLVATELIPIIGGFTTTVLDTPLAH
jgi:hypothetical protein